MSIIRFLLVIAGAIARGRCNAGVDVVKLLLFVIHFPARTFSPWSEWKDLTVTNSLAYFVQNIGDDENVLVNRHQGPILYNIMDSLVS